MAVANIVDSPETRISVVMCTLNGESFISEQLNSIARQTRLPYELIVADDGSTDGTIQSLETFGKTAPFQVRLIRSEPQRLGVTKNFERAMRAAVGDIIVLSDQDDVWHIDRLSRTENVFKQAPSAGYCFSNAEIINECGAVLPETLWQRIGFGRSRFEKFNRKQQLCTLLGGNNFTYGMSMAIRSKLLSCVLPIDSKSRNCTHDVWSALILSAIGYYGIAVDECWVRYRQHSFQVAGAGDVQFSIWASVLRSLRSSRVYDSQLPIDLEAAALRIKEIAPQSPEANLAAKLVSAKAIHLIRRELAYRQGLPWRSLMILNELRSGRYRCFSASWRTALRDLIA